MDELLNELKLRIAAIEARLNRYETAVVPFLPPRPGSGRNPGAQYETVYRPKGQFNTPEEVQAAAQQGQMEAVQQVSRSLPTPPNHAGGNP